MITGYWPQVTFVAIFGSILYFGSLNHMEDPVTEDERYQARIKNVRRALLAILVVYFGHRVFNPNIYELFKPYHRLWRVFANTCYVYLYILVFIYMMNPYDARTMWSFVEERLGKPVTKDYHTYDDDCEVTWYNIFDNMDHYFLAHFTNWFLAAIILRDAPLLHFWSILDEILELSAQYKLPHFRE
jgi:phosphatidylserine synthase 2